MSFRIRLVLISVLCLSLVPVLLAEDKPTEKKADEKKKPVEPRQALLEKAGYVAVPMTNDTEGLGFLVPVEIDKRKLALDLDTGAATSLDLAVAKEMKLELGPARPHYGLAGDGVAYLAQAPNLKLGSYELFDDLQNLPFEVFDRKAKKGSSSGIFGRNMMDPWGMVIDYPTGNLYLRSPIKAAMPKLAGVWKEKRRTEDGVERKPDEKTSLTWEFADERLKVTVNGTTTVHRIMLARDGEAYSSCFFDEKDIKKGGEVTAKFAGLFKTAGNKLTACLRLDFGKVQEIPTEFKAGKGSGLSLIEFEHTDPEFSKKKSIDPLRESLLKDNYIAVPMEQDMINTQRVVSARIGKEQVRLIVDTGCTAIAIDKKLAARLGAKEQNTLDMRTLTGITQGKLIELKSMTVGKYDTRSSWNMMQGVSIDLTGMNAKLKEIKVAPVDGLLGHLDLLNGSAIVDFHTDTLYLKPAHERLRPKLEGIWVGMTAELDGVKGPMDSRRESVQFKGDRMYITRNAVMTEYCYHVQDFGSYCRFGAYPPKADPMAEGFDYTEHWCFRLDGDEMQFLVIADPTKYKEGPVTFAAPKNSGLYLANFKRAK
jgi:predicted aspartyl protease